MAKSAQCTTGIELLINKYKNIFRIPENVNHYSENDFQIAERKFLKYVLFDGADRFTNNSESADQYH